MTATPPVPLTRIEISKEYLHFNSGHFTIFSATQREDLHGHTFYVKALIDSQVADDGLAFDYNLVKGRLQALCNRIDEKVLLPEHSPYLGVAEENGYVAASFADEKLLFLPRDVVILPVANITIEQLAPWFLTQLLEDAEIRALNLPWVEVSVSSGPGQWASAIAG